jgi:hypothetical protein
MLVANKNKPVVNDIVALKLITGEEIIAKLIAVEDVIVANFTEKAYVVTKPFVQTLHQMANGQGAVGFAPFMMAIEPTTPVTIPISRLLCLPTKARQDATTQYVKATSGLDLPPSGLVTP